MGWDKNPEKKKGIPKEKVDTIFDVLWFATFSLLTGLGIGVDPSSSLVILLGLLSIHYGYRSCNKILNL